MNERYWLFNTDETEQEGEGAFREMLEQGVIAAWGHCHGTGARATLDKPEGGETVFFFRAGHGIIAGGRVSGGAFKATSIFGKPDEYHRTVTNLRVLPGPLTVTEIRDTTGYDLPCRHIVCRLNHADGVRFILGHFRNVPAELEEIRREVVQEGGFDPADLADARRRILRSIVLREGRDQFRRVLIEAYSGTCLVTGCRVAAVLEAGHIIPYLGPKTNEVANGLLLRADIHTLFDLDLLGIEPEKLTVEFHPGIDAEYREYAGRPLRSAARQRIDKRYLADRYATFSHRKAQPL